MKDINPNIYSYKTNNNNRSLNNIVGIMVDFQEDNDPETSGNGKFLDNEEDNQLNYINYNNKYRCNEDQFLLDKAPHDRTYFELQLEALKNYYLSISNGNYDFDYQILPTTYTLDNNMHYYATSDDQIGLLFADGLEIAKNDIEELNLNYENTLFVVFHAGLGQEASQDFDPTIYDIKSAYIDLDMLDSTPSDYWINNNLFNGSEFYGGLVMPETLNWIYYDVIEDIFPIDLVNYNELDNFYCDIQLSMTGLFAYLLGYHYGFHPMYNIENGTTRVGKFGLMDVGFYNWNGIIPSRPVPWTRNNNGINTETIDITDQLFSSDQYEEIQIQQITQSSDKIYKIRISENEYFLIEKRNNIIQQNKSLECIIDYYRDYSSHCILSNEIEGSSDYIEDNDNYKNIFDVITSQTYGSYFEYDQDYNVITKVNNYDYGLPGAGILIWHINENNFDENNIGTIGINGDLDSRVISLEEADGVKNIGNPNYLIFTDISKGWRYDYWNRWIEGLSNEHDMYLNINYGENNWPFNYEITFSNSSVPNSNTDSNVDSNLSIRINHQNNIEAKVENDYQYEEIFIDENIKVIGNDGIDCIYYNKDNQLYKHCDGSTNCSDILNPCFLSDEIDENSRIFYDTEYQVININEYSTNVPMGYYYSVNNMEEISGSIALGDIDNDGLDEKIIINNRNLEVYNYSNNDVLSNGFPVYGEFHGFPLISDILDNDGTPEIICKNSDHISFISYEGVILYEIPLYSEDADLYIVPNWGNESYAALVNGDVLYKFNYNDEKGYWLNPFSTPDFSSVVGVPDRQENVNDSEIGIDMSKTYNYPNPIEDGYTKFRFFVHNSNFAHIIIYDAAGFLVDKLHSTNLIPNTYNEITWNTNNLDSGLYFAELISDKKESKLIKIVIL